MNNRVEVFMVLLIGWLLGISSGAVLTKLERGAKAQEPLQLVDAPKPPDAPQALVFPPKHGTYNALLLSAIDGDTIKFAFLVEERGRLAGINARELHEPGGQQAKEFLAAHLPKGPVPVTVGPDKYGRVLVNVHLPDGKTLSDVMVESNHAKRWDGKGQKP